MHKFIFALFSRRHLAALVLLSGLLAACGGGGGGNGSTPPPVDGGDGDSTAGPTPDAFAFEALADAAPDFSYTSATATISGIDTAAAIGITGVGCTYAIDDGELTNAAGSIDNNQTVRVQARAASAYDTATVCTLTVGSVSADFTVTTGSNGFAFEIHPGKLALAWDGFAGVTRYELTRHNAATGDSAMIANDIAADVTAFELPLSTRFTDWINDRFTLTACGDAGCFTLPDHDAALTQALSAQAIHYLKASNTEAGDKFGYSVALDGDTLAVGAYGEDGIDNGTQDSSGAVYVFERDATGAWSEPVRLKAGNTGAADNFGVSLALDGDTLAVGAHVEDGAHNGTQNNSGAVYVFVRNAAGTWNAKPRLKASNVGGADFFGTSLALDGDTLVIGADGEDGADDGTQMDSGAVYVFERDAAGAWSEQVRLKASNAGTDDRFGIRLALDGDTLAVGAYREDGADDGTQDDSGAVYVFERDAAGAWSEQVRLKAENADAFDSFGISLALDGDTLAVGANLEDGADDGTQDDSGAVYIFARDAAGAWNEQARLKADNAGASDFFGTSVALDGDTLAVGADGEDGAAIGVDGDPAGNSAANSGAAYVFRRGTNGDWTQADYLKAGNTDAYDFFGISLALDSDTLAVGAYREDSRDIGVNGDQANDSAESSGAVYIY